MEIAIALFLGVWLTAAGELAFRRIKKDLTGKGRNEKKDE